MTDLAIPIFPSRDLDATIAFYGRMGFHVLSRYKAPDPYLILGRGDVELHFFKWREFDPWMSIASCFLRVDDVGSWYDAFEEVGLPDDGIPRLTRPAETDHGTLEFALVDLDGNLVRVGQAL